MKDVRERIIAVERDSVSAHERLDRHEIEITSLRDSRHLLANSVQKHEGQIGTHNEILVGIKTAVSELTLAVHGFKIMAGTSLALGSAFIAFCGFVGGKLLHWW